MWRKPGAEALSAASVTPLRCAPRGRPTTQTELGSGEDEIDEAIEKMIPTLKKNKGEVFGSFKKLTMEDAEEIYRSAV